MRERNKERYKESEGGREGESRNKCGEQTNLLLYHHALTRLPRFTQTLCGKSWAEVNVYAENQG